MHLVDGCFHNHRILLTPQETEQFAKVRWRQLTLQVIIVNQIQQGIAVQVIACCDETHGQNLHIVIIECKATITATILVWNNIARSCTTLLLEGHGWLLHINLDSLRLS